MKTILLAAALCVGALLVPMTAHAGGSAKTKKSCGKETMSVECIKDVLKSDKVFEDIAAGKKPNVKLDSLPLGDLAKLLSR
jgi:hypothetical protein